MCRCCSNLHPTPSHSIPLRPSPSPPSPPRSDLEDAEDRRQQQQVSVLQQYRAAADDLDLVDGVTTPKSGASRLGLSSDLAQAVVAVVAVLAVLAVRELEASWPG